MANSTVDKRFVDIVHTGHIPEAENSVQNDGEWT